MSKIIEVNTIGERISIEKEAKEKKLKERQTKLNKFNKYQQQIKQTSTGD